MSHWSSLGLLALVAVSILPWVMLRRGGTWGREAVDGHLIGAVLAASILLGACRILAFMGDSLGTGLVTPGHAAAAAVPLSALALAWISRAKPWPGKAAPTAPRRVAGPRWSVADRAALALGALAFLWLSLLLLVTGPSGTEAHAYVIPLGAHFAQTRSLAIWDSAYMHTYPADTSVITALLLQAGLKGLIAVQQLPFLILLIATLYAYCKRLCTDGRIALRMSLGAAFVPVIGVLGMTGYPDIQGVAFATIAVYFVLFRIEGPIPWPIVGGLSGSLAFNAKSLHAVPIAIAAIIIALRGVLERLRLQAGHSPRAWITDLVLFSGFVLLGSSYWLVRNYSEFGNPLYPVPVPLLSSLLGWPGSPGFIANQLERAVPTEREWVSQSWQWVLYPWQGGALHRPKFQGELGARPLVCGDGSARCCRDRCASGAAASSACPAAAGEARILVDFRSCLPRPARMVAAARSAAALCAPGHCAAHCGRCCLLPAGTRCNATADDAAGLSLAGSHRVHRRELQDVRHRTALIRAGHAGDADVLP
jgi:hypothetical protein